MEREGEREKERERERGGYGYCLNNAILFSLAYGVKGEKSSWVGSLTGSGGTVLCVCVGG